MRFSVASTADRFLPQALAARARPILDRFDDIVLTRDDRGQASRTSLIAFAIRVVSAAFALFSQVLMARWMGGFEYGIFVLVWTTMIILGSLSCLGFDGSLIRHIPEYRALGRLPELRGVMALSRAVVLAVSTGFAGLGLLGIWLLSDHIESYYVIPFYLGIVCLPMIALSDTYEGMARANSWAVLSLGPIYLLRPVLILAFMGAAVLGGFLPDAETAMAAAILATWLTTFFQVATISPRVAREVAHVRPAWRIREWLLISLPILLVEGFFFLLTNVDVLMVGWFLTPTDVAIYFATVKTLALVHFVYFAVKAGAAQRYAQYAHGGGRDRLAHFARETVSWTFWPSLAMGALILVIGKPLLMLFGPGFDAGYPLLFVLVLGVVARAAVGPAESLLTMSGNHNICAAVSAATLAISIGLNLAMIPAFGLWGAAVATATAMAFEAALLALTVWRRLGIVMFIPLSGNRGDGGG